MAHLWNKSRKISRIWYAATLHWWGRDTPPTTWIDFCCLKNLGKSTWIWFSQKTIHSLGLLSTDMTTGGYWNEIKWDELRLVRRYWKTMMVTDCRHQRHLPDAQYFAQMVHHVFFPFFEDRYSVCVGFVSLQNYPIFAVNTFYSDTEEFVPLDKL